MHRQDGFTLLEVVVSLLLLAVMSLMAWQSVDVVLRMNERSRGDLGNELALQATWEQIGHDLFHLRPRIYHDGLGGIEAAYQTGQGDVRLSFTRGGAAVAEANPVGLSRVEYVLTPEGELQRRSWPVVSARRTTEVAAFTLLEEVASLQFEQLDAGYFFDANWPPLNEERALDSLPVLIRVSLELRDGLTSTRLFPGLESPLSGGAAPGEGDDEDEGEDQEQGEEGDDAV